MREHLSVLRENRAIKRSRKGYTLRIFTLACCLLERGCQILGLSHAARGSAEANVAMCLCAVTNDWWKLDASGPPKPEEEILHLMSHAQSTFALGNASSRRRLLGGVMKVKRSEKGNHERLGRILFVEERHFTKSSVLLSGEYKGAMSSPRGNCWSLYTINFALALKLFNEKLWPDRKNMSKHFRKEPFLKLLRREKEASIQWQKTWHSSTF